MGKTGKTEQDERGLLPYPVIIAATKGDPEAMQIIIHHYDSYISWSFTSDENWRKQITFEKRIANF